MSTGSTGLDYLRFLHRLGLLEIDNIEVLRGIILGGVGWHALWDEALVLLSFGILFMLLSAWRFKKRLG